MFKYLRSIIFWSVLIFDIVFLSLILPLLSVFAKDKEKFYFSAISFFSRILLIISGVPIEVTGKENLKKIDKAKTLLIAVNHASFLDYFILQAAFPSPLKFVVHGAGFHLPFLKTLYEQMGYIGTGRKEVSYLLYKTLKEKCNLVIFSRPATKGEEQIKFSEGILRLSSSSQAPILPIAIKNSSKVLPLGKFWFGRGKIKIVIGEPSFFTSVQDLQNKISQL